MTPGSSSNRNMKIYDYIDKENQPFSDAFSFEVSGGSLPGGPREPPRAPQGVANDLPVFRFQGVSSRGSPQGAPKVASYIIFYNICITYGHISCHIWCDTTGMAHRILFLLVLSAQAKNTWITLWFLPLSGLHEVRYLDVIGRDIWDWVGPPSVG